MSTDDDKNLKLELSLNGQRHVVVLGDQRGGKTETLRQIAQKLRDAGHQVIEVVLSTSSPISRPFSSVSWQTACSR